MCFYSSFLKLNLLTNLISINLISLHNLIFFIKIRITQHHIFYFLLTSKAIIIATFTEINEDFFAKSWRYQDSYVRNNVNLNWKIDYAVYGMKFLCWVFIPRALIGEYQNHVNWWISISCQLMNIRIMSIDEYQNHVNWWISESC